MATKPKCLDGCRQVLLKGQVVWLNEKQNRLYTWDKATGEYAIHARNGVHLATFDANGHRISYTERRRKLDVENIS